MNRIGVLLLGLLVLCPSAFAQNWGRSDTRIMPVPVAKNGQEYELYTWVAPECTRAHPCPAVYMMDAEYSFGVAVPIIEHLVQRHQMPPLILLSIAYRDKSQYRRNRTRDYTPWHTDTGGYGPAYQKVSGGGPAFLDVIEQQIIPMVESKLPVDKSERGYVGHSYGGLFGDFALQAKPGLFTRILLVSPSLWYDAGKMFEREERLSDTKMPKPVRVWIGVGSYEEQPENHRAMVSDARRMVNALNARKDPNLQAQFREFADETHASIFPAAFSTGMRHLWAWHNWDDENSGAE